MVAARLAQARALAAKGQTAEAERMFGEVLAMKPDELEALNFVVMRALADRRLLLALTALERAERANPISSDIFRGLGLVHATMGRLDQAIDALIKGLALLPRDFSARLMLGELLEKQGDAYGAVAAFFGAITHAQMLGQWLDDATTPAPQRAAVRHAMDVVIRGRRQLFDNVIGQLRAHFGRSELRRVESAISIYLRDALPNYPDARQQPLFLYFPDLPTHPYFEPSQFDWIPRFESETAAIREELMTVLTGADRFEPFHGALPAEQMAQYLSSSGAPPNWDSYFFYRHGAHYAEHAQQCPRTAAAIEALPLARVAGHAPEAMYSVLTPGTHILPHRGVTNTRLVTHLPLIIPADCAIVVGGESHHWQEGRCMVFDDTFEHEAWNRSTTLRAVLIVDIWNPYLDEAERGALSELITIISDFNRDCAIS